jgi:hypothetical protein
MAQPDLIAQKIVGTDPQVGFGESTVLPYRQHHLDTRGFEALERAKQRDEAAQEARKRNNEDYYHATIKNLPVYQRVFEEGLGKIRNEIIDEGGEIIRRGGNPRQVPGYTKKVMAFAQAANATKQLDADLESVNSMPVSKYTNRESLKGAALKNYTEAADRINKGDFSGYSASITPDVNDPEHFMFDAYYDDKYSKRPDTITSTDQISYGSLGERITDKKVTARFVTKDAKGNVVPGIDPSVIKDELYTETTDPFTLQSRNATYALVDKIITNKALELKSDPKYKDMGVNAIKASISSNPSDSYYKEFGKNKLAEGIVKNKLEQHQRVSNETDITSGHKYDKTDGGDGTKKVTFKMQPAVITQESGTGNTHNAPGVVISKNDKPLTFNIAANTIYDWRTGLKDEKNKDRVPVQANSVGFALTDKKSNKIMAFDSPEKMAEYIKNTPLKDLKNFSFDQYIFGNIQEKKKVGGDTGDDEGETEDIQNRSVAVKYNPDGETGALLNIYSDGAFAKREFSPDEKMVKDAWEQRMKKKEVKPETVIQNGVTFILNKATGEYNPK